MNVLVEAPLARLLADQLGRDRALDILRRIVEDPNAQTEAGAAAGNSIEIYESEHEEVDHIVQCVNELHASSRVDGQTNDDAVYWDNCGVVMRGRTLPETVALQGVDRSMKEIVDHPYLTGLVVTEVINGEDALVVDAADSLWCIERIAEAL